MLAFTEREEKDNLRKNGNLPCLGSFYLFDRVESAGFEQTGFRQSSMPQ
jgi:hypothetical protein